MATMLLLPLLIAMVFLVIFWSIKEIFTLLIFNFSLMFLIVDFESYFSMTDVTASAELHMIYLFVAIAIIGWAKIIILLERALKKSKVLIEEGEHHY